MSIGTADPTMVLAAGAAGHQAITKIDQTAQGDEKKKDLLLESHAEGNAGLFFQDSCFANMGPQPRLIFAQKNRLVKIPPL